MDDFDLLDRYPLLDWLPGETLFSLVSRLHRFWGFTLASHTCEALFGHPQQGTQHDFPSRLNTFVSRTNGRYGLAHELALERTLLGYYRPFHEAEAIRAACGAMASDNIRHLKLKLGLLTSRFRANHPLRACRLCMQEDLERFGWSYWHLVHQFPGVWVCTKHASVLSVSSVKSTGVGRFHLTLPVDSGLLDPSPCSLSAIEAAIALAELVQSLVGAGSDESYVNAKLLLLYRQKLTDRNWLSQRGRLFLAELSRDYARHLSQFAWVSELPPDMLEPNGISASVGRLLRGLRSGTHPLRHLMVIHWLFHNSESFFASNDQLNTKSSVAQVPGRRRNALRESTDSRTVQQARLRELLLVEMCSVTAAASQVGIDVATAMAWATKMNIPVARRPKVLKADVRSKAIELLSNGADKRTVSEQLSLSLQTVTRLLLTEIGLHDKWKEAQFASAQQTNRAAWSSMIESFGSLGVKAMRKMVPAVFAWLYRNDRDWLEMNKVQIGRKSPTGVVQRVDWDRRDQVLSVMVLKVAHQIAQDKPGCKVKLWQLYQALPELKAKLGALSKLPLTRRAIADVTGAKPKTLDRDLLE